LEIWVVWAGTAKKPLRVSGFTNSRQALLDALVKRELAPKSSRQNFRNFPAIAAVSLPRSAK
jgi:hypothetical protein